MSLRATRASCLELLKNFQPTYENSRATAIGAWCVVLPSKILTSAVQGPRTQATRANSFDLPRSFKLKRPHRLRHNLPLSRKQPACTLPRCQDVLKSAASSQAATGSSFDLHKKPSAQAPSSAYLAMGP